MHFPACRAEPFTGDFPEMGPPLVHSESVGQRFKLALEAARNMLAGEHRLYAHSSLV